LIALAKHLYVLSIVNAIQILARPACFKHGFVAGCWFVKRVVVRISTLVKFQGNDCLYFPDVPGQLDGPRHIIWIILACSAVVVLLNSESNFETDLVKVYDLGRIKVLRQK
jgi:hypothetical protein